MNKLTMLFIRACKSRNPLERLKTLTRRFYLVDDDATPCIKTVLTGICEDYKLISLSGFILSMHPQNVWKYKDSDTDDPTLKILISAVRHSSVDKFPGYIPSRRVAH